jgi:glycosyltransferase involved in cell wall biosynthesis
MKLLRVIATVDPATGGPVAGLRAITPALAELGHTSEFLTVDQPTDDYLQSFVGPVHAMGPARGSYSYSPRLHRWLERHLAQYDAIIVHGLWQDLGRTIHALCRQPNLPPYFVMPHGMLDPTLRRTYPVKHVKKLLYWLLVERRVLRDARAVLFTCEEERRLARLTFPDYRCEERVVGYGAAAPREVSRDSQIPWAERCPAVVKKNYIVFLGRIHSKKGVDLLLRAYARWLAENPPATRAALPDLVLAGPCLDDAYLAALQKLAVQKNVAERVHWTGMLTGAAKWAALEGAEAFVLPSHQENFGVAVAESLAVGTPVLISDRVNIWREVAQDRAALVEPDSEEGTLRLLRRWLQLPAQDRGAMREAAKRCFQARFEIANAARTFASELSALIQTRKSNG